MKKIEYYFDCSSPWTYLSFRGLLGLKEEYDLDIVWKPILVGGIFNSINSSVYESRKNPVKEKSDYSQKDLLDWATVRNITINWPKIFPINSVKAMRGAFFAIDQLSIWAERVDVDIVKQDMGSDPASVCFDTLQSAKAKNADIVIRSATASSSH